MRASSSFFVGAFLTVCLGVSASACTAATGSGSSGGSSSGGGQAQDFCSSLCGRVNDCDQTQDKDTCVNNCQNQTATTVSKLRSDVVTAVESCVQSKDCATVLSSSFFDTCLSEAVASIAPSSEATQFCNDWAAAETKCGSTLDQTACLDTVKAYSDDTVGMADACVSKACSDVEACIEAAFGWSGNPTGGGSGGSGSGGSGSGGSGSGGSTCSLTVTFSSASCNACVGASCCGGDRACGGTPDCIAELKCLGACASGNTVCTNACRSAHPSGDSVLVPFANCLESNCATACQ
jgi:hypothetical protein